MAVVWFDWVGFRKSNQAGSAWMLTVGWADRVQERFHFLNDHRLLLSRQLIPMLPERFKVSPDGGIETIGFPVSLILTVGHGSCPFTSPE
jgi:hypothetical protein